MSKKNVSMGTVVVEVDSASSKMLVQSGRVSGGMYTFRCRAWESLPRCYRCLGFGHDAAGCKRAEVYDNCGNEGYRGLGWRKFA